MEGRSGEHGGAGTGEKSSLGIRDPVRSVCFTKDDQIEVRGSCGYKPVNKVWRADRNIPSLLIIRVLTVKEEEGKNGECSRWSSRGGMLGGFLWQRQLPRHAQHQHHTHTTPPPLPDCKALWGKKREVVRRCCSPDFTSRKHDNKNTRKNKRLKKHVIP